MLLKDKWRENATLTKAHLKLRAGKLGKDQAKQKFIDLEFEVRLSAALRGRLGRKLQPLVTKAEAAAEDGEVISKVDYSEASSAILKIFGHDNFKDNARPSITVGPSPQVNAKVTGIIFRDGEPLVMLRCSFLYAEEVLAWVGKHFGEAERDVCIEVAPLQPELPLEGEDEKDKVKKARKEKKIHETPAE